MSILNLFLEGSKNWKSSSQNCRDVDKTGQRFIIWRETRPTMLQTSFAVKLLSQRKAKQAKIKLLGIKLFRFISTGQEDELQVISC